MIGTGPLGGHVVETGLVIASTDALAADVVGARLLGFQPQAVRHLEAGRLRESIDLRPPVTAHPALRIVGERSFPPYV